MVFSPRNNDHRGCYGDSPLFTLTDLWQTVGSWLEDDEQHANGYCDLFQLQVVGHPRPPQHPTHAVLGGHSKLTEANGETVQLGRWQTQAVDQSLGEMTCGGTKRIKTHFTANRLHSGVLYVNFISVLSVYLLLLLTPCLFCWHWGSHLSFP